MSGESFIENGVLITPGQTRCAHWPRTCAEAQATTATVFEPCEFCRYGPEEPPTRRDQNTISLEEAEARASRVEEQRGEKLREAVLLILDADDDPPYRHGEGR